jgi:CRP-like cAMP-binding protein
MGVQFPSRSLRSLAADETLFEEGSTGRAMYVVRQGSVRVLRGDGPGRQEVASLGPGSLFGELALPDEAPRSATVAAGAEGAVLVEIDHALFVYLVGQQPAFALLVMQSMAQRLRARLHQGELTWRAA